MPRTRSLAWSELKIGIIAVGAIALAVIFIIAVGGQGGFSWEQYTLVTRFTDVKGLKSGAVVRVAGVEVGKVDEVKLSGSEVEVRLKDEADFAAWVAKKGGGAAAPTPTAAIDTTRRACGNDSRS